MAYYTTNNSIKNSKKIKIKKNIGIALICIFSILLINLTFNLVKLVNSFFLGAFGLFSYVIFITLIIEGILLICNKSIYISILDFIILSFWFLNILLIIQVATSSNFFELGYAKYICKCYEIKNTCGGAILSILTYPLYILFSHNVAIYTILSIIVTILSSVVILRLVKYKDTFIDLIKGNNIKIVNKERNNKPIKESVILDEPKTLIKPTHTNTSNNDNIFIADEETEDLGLNTKEIIIDTSEKDKIKAKNILGLNNSTLDDDTNAISNLKPEFIHNNEEFNNYESKIEKPQKFIHTDSIKNEKPSKKLTESDKENLKYLHEINGNYYKNTQKDLNSNTTYKQQNDLYDNNLTKNNYKNNYLNKPQQNFIFDEDESFENKTNSNISKNSYNSDKYEYSTSNSYIEENTANNNENDSINSNNFINENDNYKDDINTNNKYFNSQHNNYKSNIKIKEEFKVDNSNNQIQDNVSLKTVETNSITPNVITNYKKKQINYVKPPLDLLKTYESKVTSNTEDYSEKAQRLEEALLSFNIPTKVVTITKGPSFTRFELQMQQGVSVKKVNSHIEDIAMVLEATGEIRTEIPILGKNAFGVEIPNENIETVGLKDILESYNFQGSKSLLTFGLGKDISGECKVARIEKMPHLLIAGSTGSGKSVCLNALLISLIYKASPKDVRLILIDPKRVEFTLYNGLPHLLLPNVITSIDKALKALDWLINEMEKRFNLFSESRVRNLEEYNNLEQVKSGIIEKLPNIVFVIDELGDLMLQNKKEFEEKIIKLTQKSRAAGIYLVLATQRPSVDVLTGTIKVNLPSRIAFAVSSFPDSKTILDQGGAEKLLGKGDMLYFPQDVAEPIRIQGAFVSNEEVEAVVEYVKENNEADFDSDIEDEMFNPKQNSFSVDGGLNQEFDVLLKDAVRLAIRTQNISVSKIQRAFGVGYPRAGKIVDQMESAGFISAQDNKKMRTIFVTQQEFEERFGEDL